MLVLKESSIKNAGIGVFTKKKIKKYEIVCFYDGDDVDKHCNPIDDGFIMSHPLNPDLIRIGYKQPKCNKGVGQLLNDGAKLNITDDMVMLMIKTVLRVGSNGFQPIVNAFATYHCISTEKQNTQFIDDKFNMIATKNIDKHHELYFRYGFVYWLRDLQMKSISPTTRLFVDVLCGVTGIINDHQFMIHGHVHMFNDLIDIELAVHRQYNNRNIKHVDKHDALITYVDMIIIFQKLQRTINTISNEFELLSSHGCNVLYT